MRKRNGWLILASCCALAACADPVARFRERENFHALGHAPGWTLTINNNRLMFATSSPRTRLEVPRPLTQATMVGRRYQAAGLTLDVEHEPCNDVRSGSAFAETVTVIVGEYSYRGCGGERTPLLDR